MAATGLAGYVLEDDYMQAGFFDQFSFWDSSDPTHGFVDYKGYQDSLDAKLISNISSSVYMGVDSTNVTPNGRPSVRISSNKVYNQALVVLDVAHMPGGICGTWPAFWLLGPNWPNGGEIDIIEGVNDQSTNDITLHTGPTCNSIDNTKGYTGTLTHTTCQSSGDSNTGCQIAASDSDTYGTGFNANGGGVYATEWTDDHISVWFFPRSSIPSDVLSDAPDPSGWGTPLAKFVGGDDCDISKSFVDQQIVFDTTFCGDWAGNANVWSEGSCSQLADTCEAYVENHPAAFQEAYWSINALKVYQNNGPSSPPPSTAYPSMSSAPNVSIPTPASTIYATQTSILYVPHPGPATTFAVSTKSASDGGYAPIVGISGSIDLPVAPAPSSTPETQIPGLVPIIGPGGIIGGQHPASSAVAPVSPSQTQLSGSAPVVGVGGTVDLPNAAPSDGGEWSNAPDGAAIFDGREDEQQKRHIRHMERHKRHWGGSA